MPNPSANGKLNGAITPKTPYGRRTSRVALVGRQLPEGRLESVGRLDLAAVRLDQVDRLLDLGDRLGPHLPHLEADRRRELELALVDQPLRRPQDRDALCVRQPAPFALRCLRRLDRLARRARRPRGRGSRPAHGATDPRGRTPRRPRPRGRQRDASAARPRAPALPRAPPRTRGRARRCGIPSCTSAGSPSSE